MSKLKLTKVPFLGTKEQEKELRSYLEIIKSMPGAVMPALQKAQELYNYLPIEVQTIIAEVLDLPPEEIFGIATFYSQFTLNPRGKYNISVCLGTPCYVKGANDVVNEFRKKLGVVGEDATPDGKFSVCATRCIGCCGLAPVLTVNKTVYGKIYVKDVDRVLSNYLEDNK